MQYLVSILLHCSKIGSMKIVLVDNDAVRAELLEKALGKFGVTEVSVLEPDSDLVERIGALDPDVLLIDLESPSRDALEQMFDVTRAVSRPVAMFVDGTGAESISAAIDAGVGAYVVDGMRPDRVKSILDLAISRYNSFAQMRSEMEAAKAALDERKMLERAKGLLMKSRGLSEDEAYVLLRKSAMDRGKRIAEIAETIVTAAELLG